MKTVETDILIIGAGPAGTVAAANLLKQGFAVTLIEKSIFPRFTIGESLLPKVMHALDKNNLIEAIEKCDFQKKEGAQFIKDGEKCFFEFKNKFTEGWDWTWQVTRADFDKALSDEVERRGAIIEFDTSVEEVKFLENEVKVTTLKKDNKTIYTAKYIVDASGNGKVLPRLLDLMKPSELSPKEAVFSHFIETNPPQGVNSKRITAIVHEQDTWVWIIPLSDNKCSVGVVASPSFFEPYLQDNGKANLTEVLANIPETKERFKTVNPVFEPPHLKSYSSSVTQFYGDRYVLVGNTTEFLDPIFSSGVTLAVESAEVASNLIGKELRNERVNWEIEYSEHLKKGIDTFRTFVEAWYSGDLYNIFFTDEKNAKIKEQLCSVLAGYVWDEKNPFVFKHKQAVSSLSKLLKLKKLKSNGNL